MANPFLNANLPNLEGLGQIKQMYNAMNSGNPISLITQMNPQLGQALQNGANPEAIFRDMCKKQGIDPEQFLNNLKKQMR